ncbi:MAG: hypothetical protein AAF841_05815 [Pseudomonadota bacterium]
MADDGARKPAETDAASGGVEDLAVRSEDPELVEPDPPKAPPQAQVIDSETLIKEVRKISASAATRSAFFSVTLAFLGAIIGFMASEFDLQVRIVDREVAETNAFIDTVVEIAVSVQEEAEVARVLTEREIVENVSRVRLGYFLSGSHMDVAQGCLVRLANEAEAVVRGLNVNRFDEMDDFEETVFQGRIVLDFANQIRSAAMDYRDYHHRLGVRFRTSLAQLTGGQMPRFQNDLFDSGCRQQAG